MKLWSNSTVPGNGSFVPEKRLLAAVLQRAVADYIGGEEDMRVEAGRWIMSDDEIDSPLTFRFICEALDLNVDLLRGAIQSQARASYSERKVAVS